MSNIYEVLDNFAFDGDLISCEEFGSGHINNTYICEYNNGASNQKYIVQRINNTVFKDVDGLMNNIFSVTSFLREKIKAYGGNPDRETLHYIKTKNGKNYYLCSDGACFRAYIYVKDSVSYDTVDCAETFKSSGIAFGRFQKLLSDFPASTLFETIPNFHNTKWRYENEFLKAVNDDFAGRKNDCVDDILFVQDRKNKCNVLVDLIEQGKLPLRVTHNDTKLNNVMFDTATNKCICVIDLDTVMPGLALYDFGDSIRFGANTAVEDEKDLSKVSLNLDYFKAYSEGFLSEAGKALNKYEIEYLPYSAVLMTLECGMRFLTDYLNGDVYFKTDYPTHNLDRARNQFKLVTDMENKYSQMQSIINNIEI